MFLECLVELDRDLQTLSGGILLVDIGPTYSQPAQNHLSADIVCKYINLKLVKGEGRGKRFLNRTQHTLATERLLIIHSHTCTTGRRAAASEHRTRNLTITNPTLTSY